MKSLFLTALLSLLTAAAAGAESFGALDVLPGMSDVDKGAVESKEVLQRPDSQKIMAELAQPLKLSARQEERISKAVDQKTREFDKIMKELEKNSAEEKRWRAKAEGNREAMSQINRGLPDLIREYLDDEQRQSYDDLQSAKNKPATIAEPAIAPAAVQDSGAQPRKKRRLVRRKKASAAAAPSGTPAVAPAGEEPGSVMVDEDSAGTQPRKKRRVLRRSKAAAPAAPQAEQAPAPSAASAPGGQPAQVEDGDAGDRAATF